MDDEVLNAATKFIDGAVGQRKPFFVWFNTTRMHVWTHLKKESARRHRRRLVSGRDGGA